jgi:hypothetical protein
MSWWTRWRLSPNWGPRSSVPERAARPSFASVLAAAARGRSVRRFSPIPGQLTRLSAPLSRALALGPPAEPPYLLLPRSLLLLHGGEHTQADRKVGRH